MAANNRKIYKNRNPWAVAAAVFGIAVGTLILLALLVFFGFRRYIVYTPDGLHLEVPWLGYGITEAADVSPSPIIQS